jgi:AcrR family transcriptional regulator
MSAIPRKRLRASERRVVIEEAAARLFAEHGYAATTVEDIVASAGVTKPMLYRHFTSKKQLHLSLLAQHRDALAAGPLDAYLRGGGPLEARLPAMLDAWFDYVREHPYPWRLLFRDTTGDPDVAAFHRELQRRQRAADMAIIRESLPGIPEERLEPLGEVVRSSLTGLALWWLDHPDVPQAVLVDTMTRLLTALITSAS